MPDATGRTPPDVPRLRIERLQSPLAGPFDLSLARGECVTIAGASGSGKSLFLRMVADLDPNDGEVWLDGRARSGFAAHNWRRLVCYVQAEPGWWSDTVADHFAPADLPAARGLAEQMGVDPALLDAPVVRLSTGERQRLALARALAGSPPVLLLDEPTGALDEASTQRVEAVLSALLTAGTTMLVVSHSPAQAQRLGQRHLRMENRRLIASAGAPA